MGREKKIHMWLGNTVGSSKGLNIESCYYEVIIVKIGYDFSFRLCTKTNIPLCFEYRRIEDYPHPVGHNYPSMEPWNSETILSHIKFPGLSCCENQYTLIFVTTTQATIHSNRI